MTITVGTDLEPLVADLKRISAGRIAVRDVKIDDRRPDSRSQVVVYLTPPDPGSTWDLDDFSAVRAQIRDLVSSSLLGDDTRITSSDGDPSARMERPLRGTKALTRLSAEPADGGSAPSATVRVYAPGDAVATYEVFRAAVRRTALARYTPDQVRAWAPDEVDVERWARRRATAWTIVAVRGERVVGFADLTDGGVMDMLFVHPDHARAGIATDLVARVAGEAAGRGLARIDVHASRVLEPLLARLGFVLDQDHPDNRRGEQVLANATMHLDLQQSHLHAGRLLLVPAEVLPEDQNAGTWS